MGGKKAAGLALHPGSDKREFRVVVRAKEVTRQNGSMIQAMRTSLLGVRTCRNVLASGPDLDWLQGLNQGTFESFAYGCWQLQL